MSARLKNASRSKCNVSPLVSRMHTTLLPSFSKHFDASLEALAIQSYLLRRDPSVHTYTPDNMAGSPAFHKLVVLGDGAVGKTALTNQVHRDLHLAEFTDTVVVVLFEPLY
jgi:hypothetical protein